MKPSNPSQLSAKEIFILAAGLESAAKREALLQEHCSTNPDLLKQVQRLLAAADTNNAKSPLDAIVDAFGPEETRANPQSNGNEQLAFDPNPTMALTSIKVGGQIGRYRLMEQLGEGGMGVVYVAEQVEPVRRKVALKVIKPGMDSKQVIARFEAERQALALMDHMNIARVLDGGTTEQGLPYFVMELVRGLSITEYCDQAKATTRDRLALFIAVCNAVHHAHQKGIIHRDIKPGNVLVTLHDGKPVVKVIDFGVAKALHQQLSQNTVYTGLNQVVGTPLYMSPEQLELSGLDIDIRTDVYSLGVLLYELLTGTTPFDRERLLKSGFDEMRRIIREEEPPRPSQRITTLPKAELSTCAKKRGLDDRTFTRSMQNEVDWIVLRAMEKDRQRRFQSPRELAEDVQRYLNGDAVHACPPSTIYRLSRIVRKHRAAILTGAMILSTIIAGSLISVWQALEARKSARIAQSRSQLARSAIDDMYTKVAQEWLAQAGDMTELQRDFLEKALAYYEVLGQDNDRDPKVRIEKLRAQLRVANIHESLGRHPTAETAYSKLISDCERTATDQGGKLQSLPVKIKSMVGLARLQQEIGRSKDVVKRLKEGLHELQQQLPSFDGMNASTRQEYAEASGELARELRGASLATESSSATDACLNLRKRLAEENPHSFEHRLALAKVVSSKGTQQMWWGRENEGARKTFIEAEQMFTSLLQERPKDRSCRDATVICLWNHSVVLERLGMKEEALGLTRQSVEMQEQLHRDFPSDRKLQLSLAKNLENLVYHLEHAEDAADFARRACDLSADLVKRFPDVVEYRSTFISNSERLSLEFYIRQERTKGTAVLEQMEEKFQGYAWPKKAWGAVGELASSFSIANCTWAGIELESGNHSRAAEILAKLPPIEWSYDENYIQSVQAEHGVAQAQLELLGSIEAKIMLHSRPALLCRECMQLASNDSSLSRSEQLATIEKYRELAAEYEANAERATLDWLEYLKAMKNFKDKKISWVNSQCERLVADLAHTDITLAIEDMFIRQNQCRMCMLLIGAAMEKFPDEKGLYMLVDYLVVGPEELRDTELSLELAQRSTKAYGEKVIDPVVYAHTWALYRGGQFRACLDLYSSAKIKVDYFSIAVKAMSLWQLGQRDEAAALLNAEYD